MAGRIVSWLLGILLCLALFDVPSAFAISRGLPWGAALAVGLVAFPVLPLAWHLWGERAVKRRKTPPRTTRSERLAFRLIAVAVVVLGGLGVAARGAAARAIRHHALWLIPHDDAGRLATTAPILAHVPGDAKGMLWLRGDETPRDVMGQLFPELTETPELVAAFGPHEDHVAVFERGSADVLGALDELLAWLHERGVPRPPPPTTLADGTRAWIDPSWQWKPGPADALFALLRRVPDDAFLAGAILGAPKGLAGVIDAVGYLRLVDGDLLELRIEADTATAAQASALVKEGDDVIAKARSERPLEMSCLADVMPDLEADGARVRVRIAVRADALVALKRCFVTP